MVQTINNIQSFYLKIITQPQLLANGHQIIKQFLLSNPSYRKQSLSMITNQKIPILVLIMNLYPNQIITDSSISQQQKNQTIVFVLNTIIEYLFKQNINSKSKLINQMFQFLHKLHNVVGYQIYLSFYLQAIQKLILSQNKYTTTFIINTLKKSDDRIHLLSLQLFPLITSRSNSVFSNSQNLLQIVYYILRSTAFLKQTDPILIQQKIQPFIGSLLNYLFQNINKNNKTFYFSLKILTLLFGQFRLPFNQATSIWIKNLLNTLLPQYINFLISNQGNTFDAEDQDQDDDDKNIENFMYQTLEIVLVLFGRKCKIDYNQIINICIISCILSKFQWNNYTKLNDLYLIQIEDQGLPTIRNKSIFILDQFLNNDKTKRITRQILQSFTSIIIKSSNLSIKDINQYFQKSEINIKFIPFQYLCETALFILYSFNDQLISKDNMEFMTILSNMITKNCNFSSIIAVSILNRVVRNYNQSYKTIYLQYILNLIHTYQNNAGMLITLAKTIYTFCPKQKLKLESTILFLTQRLVIYISDQNMAQDQTAYLVIEFLIHLLSVNQNKSILQKMLSSSAQISIFRRFQGLGLTQSLVIDLLAKTGNYETLNTIFQALLNNNNNNAFVELISKAIQLKTYKITQSQLIILCQVYYRKISNVSNIIAAYLDTQSITNLELINFFNQKLSENQKWISGLVRQGKLYNIKQNTIRVIQELTYNIQSPQKFENHLVLPYISLLNDTQATLTTLHQINLLIPFIDKLLRYGNLFKGVHLKIITAQVLIKIAALYSQIKTKVIQLIQRYGQIQGSQWQDENIGEQQQDYYNEGIVQKILSSIVNDNVQELFGKIFGELAWNNDLMQQNLNKLKMM